MRGIVLGALLIFGALPHTGNYQLNSYGFGSGGTAGSSTATYSIEGETGDLSSLPGTTSTYTGKPGFVQTEQANVPQISLDTESGLDYNKLHFVLSPNSDDPSDAKYLIAVTTTSTTDMDTASGVSYVQPDGTLSATLSLSDYQTYTTWGGAGGGYIIGLTPNTTYYAAARSTQGRYTESAYGPVVNQLTAQPSLTFSLFTSTQPTPPFSVDFGTLNPGSGTVYTTSQSITTGLSTNAASGGNIYIGGKNGGLFSSSTGYKINAVSSDLSSVNEGFGVQSNSTTQTSGGPFTVVSPYNGSSNVVGLVSPALGSLYTSSTPVTGGSGTLFLKAKAANQDVAASDYQEILTFVAAGNF